MEKDWLFYYEWCHPGEQKANAPKPKLPDPGFRQASKGLGEQAGGIASRQVLSGQPWSLVIYGEGASALDLPGQGLCL